MRIPFMGRMTITILTESWEADGRAQATAKLPGICGTRLRASGTEAFPQASKPRRVVQAGVRRRCVICLAGWLER